MLIPFILIGFIFNDMIQIVLKVNAADNPMPSTSNEQCELEHWDEDTEEQAESVELTAMENGTFHDLNEEPSICYDSADCRPTEVVLITVFRCKHPF